LIRRIWSSYSQGTGSMRMVRELGHCVWSRIWINAYGQGIGSMRMVKDLDQCECSGNWVDACGQGTELMRILRSVAPQSFMLYRVLP